MDSGEEIKRIFTKNILSRRQEREIYRKTVEKAGLFSRLKIGDGGEELYVNAVNRTAYTAEMIAIDEANASFGRSTVFFFDFPEDSINAPYLVLGFSDRASNAVYIGVDGGTNDNRIDITKNSLKHEVLAQLTENSSTITATAPKMARWLIDQPDDSLTESDILGKAIELSGVREI